MRVPLSWLQEFVPLATVPRDHEGVRDLGRVLDSLGLVVEGIEHVGDGLDEVVLARVLEIRAIKGAERIRQVLVDAGGPEPAEIVCGATNFAVGDVVPLAKVGAELPGRFVIGRRTLRGVVSDGMLCSARELGVGGDESGLLVLASTGSPDGPLPAGVEAGMPLAEHLGIVPDAVFDIAVEPNRPDCLCVTGIARDVAARLKLPFVVEVPAVAPSGAPASGLASVAIDAPEACHHLLARVVTGVAAVASPPEVARRLILAGMRPIGAVVDASNYVMLELGQPSHPYDLERLGGHGLAVRYARPGERLVTLDGVDRVLGRHTDALGRTTDVEDLVICDANGVAIGLAGVMGGAATEIGDSTTRVVIELAQFAPVVVARTAKRQGVRSEASARFERGVDPEGLTRAADRFCALLAAAAAHGGARAPVVAPGDLDAHPVSTPRRHVRVRVGRVNALLGTTLGADEVEALLAPIGFLARRAEDVPRSDGEGDAISPRQDGTGQQDVVLDVEVPSFRPDAEREVDVVEEVARHVGYERIAATPRRSPFVGTLGARTVRRRRLRRVLTGLGAHEAWTSSIVDPSLVGRAGAQHPVVAIANPMVHEESVLRAHLLPGLLGALRHNVAHRNPALRLFEIGRVFVPMEGDGLPGESEHVGVLLARDGDDAASAVHVLGVVAEQMGLDREALVLDQEVPVPEPLVVLGTHPSRRALVRAGAGTSEVLGVLGEVDPRVLEEFGIAGCGRVGWLVLDLGALDEAPARDRRARPVSRFPSSDVDLSFVLDDATPAAALESALRTSAGELCESVRLLESYRGPGIPSGGRSLTYRLRFCAPDRTLTDADVAGLRAACIAAVESGLPATLRG